MTQTETNRARTILYRNLMNVPHRDYAPMVAQLNEAMEQDPDFISRACVHLATGGTKIRDQEDCAIITLLQASNTFPEYREAGRALLLGSDCYNTEPDDIPGLPPFRLFRILRFMGESEKKSPRLTRSIAHDYAHMLEADPLRFDGVALQNRRNLWWMYTNYHIRPNDRARAILFDDNPPPDSKLAVLKEIANSNNPSEQAKLVIKHKIPYRVAVSVLPKVNAQIGVALICAMSPTEALNARAWVERSGLLEIKEVKEAFIEKVANATKSIASAEHRVSAKGTDAEVEEAITEAKQKSIEQTSKIEKDLLILVDKSGSMEQALETAVQFGARIAPLCANDLMVVVHNDYGQVLPVEDRNSLASWQQAFKGQRAGGGTNMERSFEVALKAGFMPQAIVLITDGGERGGNLTQAIEVYNQQSGIETQVSMIRISEGPHIDHNWLGERLQQSSIRYDQFEYEGDYYLFDQVAALLGGPSAKSLVEVILETQLPRRAK
jgi:hypothetical protein